MRTPPSHAARKGRSPGSGAEDMPLGCARSELQSPHAIDPTTAGVLENMTEVKLGFWLSNIKTRPAKTAADKLAALRLGSTSSFVVEAAAAQSAQEVRGRTRASECCRIVHTGFREQHGREGLNRHAS